MDNIVVQMLVKNPQEKDTILGTSFILRLSGSFITIILIVLSVFFTNEDPQSRLLIIVVSLSYFFQAFNVLDLYFQAKVASKFYVYASIFQNIVSSILRIVCVLLHASLVWFAWLVVVDAFSLALALCFLYYKTGTKGITWVFRINYAKKILQQSWPLILSTVAVTIYMRIDQIMIKKMLDASAVGFYAAAVRLSEGGYFIPSIIAASVFPAIIKAKSLDETLYKESLLTIYCVLTWLFIIIGIPMALFSNTIIVTLLGKEFAAAGPVLKIHIWSAYFVFLGIATSRWLLLENLQIVEFISAVFGAITNVVLNIFLIPQLGIQGAAISTLIAQFASSYFIFLFFHKGRSNLWLMIKSIVPQRTIINRLMS